ncbi:transcriptional regulator [Natronosalvus rutilus]|uniref:Transcriptional regulator n=1 Tax=Natronosalvus rutilus TaxID=2953753 RepID=A0A9E7N9J2_9EURY|nr:transcriptional regulator [Natronosalvus rutilus]UTF53296.1 transcriptional regulator [Natronosalvus rutilus]
MHQAHLERPILRALEEGSSMHVIDLAERLEAHPVTVDLACDRLYEEGCLAPSRQGTYAVTDRGRRRLEASVDG